MKKILFVLSTALFFASCKKDSSVTPDPAPGVSKKLMKATYVYNNDAPESTTYTYDVQGRISVIKQEDYTETFDYISATSLMVTQRKNADNSLKQTKECTINEMGYITKIVFKNPAAFHTYTYEYTYNAEGYMVKVKGSNPTNSSFYETEFTIIDGNMVSSKAYFDGVLTYNREYTVDPTRVNKGTYDYENYWDGTTMFGKKQKNLLKECKIFNMSGALTWHTKINYEVDADGYPIKITTDYILDGIKSVETNIYQ
jgi:hypothetical protein